MSSVASIEEVADLRLKAAAQALRIGIAAGYDDETIAAMVCYAMDGSEPLEAPFASDSGDGAVATRPVDGEEYEFIPEDYDFEAVL